MSADVLISTIEKPPPGPVRRIFFNPPSCAGWRLVIYLAVMLAVGLGIGVVIHFVRGGRTPQSLPIFDELIAASIIFLTTAVMAIIEKRELADYGLPFANAWADDSGWSCLWLVTMTMVVAAMHVAGVIAFSKGTVQGQALATYATFAALTFVFGAVFEELTCRGYLLFTLTTGMGFWPAAVLSSAIFGILHSGNPGETAFGCFSTGVLVFCFACCCDVPATCGCRSVFMLPTTGPSRSSTGRRTADFWPTIDFSQPTSPGRDGSPAARPARRAACSAWRSCCCLRSGLASASGERNFPMSPRSARSPEPRPELTCRPSRFESPCLADRVDGDARILAADRLPHEHGSTTRSATVLPLRGGETRSAWQSSCRS